MRLRRLGIIAVLFAAFGPVLTSAQSLDAEGTVTEVSGDRVVVERTSDVSVSDGDRAQVFTTTRLGGGGEQQIVAGVLRVEVVSGPIVVGRLVDQSQLVEVGIGQNVSFSTSSQASGRGTLSVRSTPTARASLVSLEEVGASPRPLGTTPVRESLAPGRYRVRLTKDGYETAERTVQVRSGETRTLRLSLDSQTGTLSVRPTPDTASVIVDGDTVGWGPVQEPITAGEHTVTVNAGGYEAATKTLSVESGRTRTFAPTLDRKMGTLRVRTTPGGADVFVDGTKVGQSPIAKDVRSGQHEVEVTKGGFAPVTKSVQVRGHQSQALDVELQRPVSVRLASGKGPVRGVEMNREGQFLVFQYNLSGDAEEYEVTLQFSGNGGNSYSDVEKALSGDVGEEVTPGTGKELRWNVFQQFPEGLYESQNVLRLRAEASGGVGGFTVEVQSFPGGFTQFGGGRVGWTMKEGFVGASYTRLAENLSIISARAMPHWTFGWFKYRMIVGAAYINGPVPSALQGGLELGSGLYVGKSVYVGGDALYLQTLAGEGQVGLILTVGVSL